MCARVAHDVALASGDSCNEATQVRRDPTFTMLFASVVGPPASVSSQPSVGSQARTLHCRSL